MVLHDHKLVEREGIPGHFESVYFIQVSIFRKEFFYADRNDTNSLMGRTNVFYIRYGMY